MFDKLPMTRFELGYSSVGSDRSANCGTTSARKRNFNGFVDQADLVSELVLT